MEKSSDSMPIELAREVARQGEVRLNALMSLATAADLRATTLCGIFGASSVGIGAATLAVFASDKTSWPLVIAGSVTCLGLYFATLLAAISGAPRDFYIAGGDYRSLKNWLWDSQWRDESLMLESTAARYGVSIEQNKKILEQGTTKISCSLWIAFASPIAGVAAFFFSRCPF